ncbi:hypothetical protein CPC08DRAFT_771405 [Agrocybe pediades]|nr:hypothetical protein CPC08DRAFT_771405 [Agrocybe pediades]
MPLVPQKRSCPSSPEDPTSSRPSLLERLSLPPTSAMVTYNANIASRNVGLHALAVPSSPSLAFSFPAPTVLRIPILRTINEEVSWINSVLALVSSVKLMHITRTNVEGQQVFWLAFQKPDQASTFRGQVANREAVGGPTVACDFVSPEMYCAATCSQPPSWSPGMGFSNGLSASSLLTDNEVIH